MDISLNVLQNSCFSLDLRTGSIIIAVTQILRGLYILSIAFTPAENLPAQMSSGSSKAANLTRIICGVYGGILLFLSLMLLFGILKEMGWMVLPWIGFSVIFYILTIMGLLYLIVMRGGKILGLIISAFIQLVLEGYCVMVVFSWYSQQS